MDSFKGNIIYSSFNQMVFKNTSRRDDLISLTYLLLTLLNGFKIPCKTESKIDPFLENGCSTKEKFLEIV